jgi:hypothetical protein
MSHFLERFRFPAVPRQRHGPHPVPEADLAKFRDDSDKKWADLWSAMTADMRKD